MSTYRVLEGRSDKCFLQQGLRWCIAIAMAAAMLVGGIPAAADRDPQDPAIVRCNPVSAAGYTDQLLQVDLYIENVVGLYGADVILTFDPDIAQVVDHDDTIPGVQIQPIGSFLAVGFNLFREADNVAGTIHYANTQLFPASAVSGSGPIARVTFQALTYGTFTKPFIYNKLSDTNGVEIPSVAVDCMVSFLSPLAVTLSDFQASSRDDHVLVSWETVSEVENQGFNLLRSMSNSGDRARLNDLLMPSQDPGSGQGAEYEWLDHEVVDGETYFYWLESVDFDGSTELSGPVTVTYESPTAVELSALITDVNASPSVPLLVLVLGLVVVLFTGLVAAESRRRPT